MIMLSPLPAADELLPGKPMSSTIGGRCPRPCAGCNAGSRYPAAGLVAVFPHLALAAIARPRRRVCAVAVHMLGHHPRLCFLDVGYTVAV